MREDRKEIVLLLLYVVSAGAFVAFVGFKAGRARERAVERSSFQALQPERATLNQAVEKRLRAGIPVMQERHGDTTYFASPDARGKWVEWGHLLGPTTLGPGRE